MNALNLIIDAQTENAKDIPFGRHKLVDLTIRHYAGHGRKVGNEALKNAKTEYKENSKKARHTIYLHNFNGIAEHGLPWKHMNRIQKLRWFREMLLSDAKMPKEVVAWAKKRKLM